MKPSDQKVRTRPRVPQGAPHFLIVGSCKSGTTNLYDDLAVHPDVFMPSNKEPDILHRAHNAEDALRLWRSHFSSAKAGDILGEGSTYYTMNPQFPDVSEFALTVLGEDARIIYLMRDPIQRIKSHLGHDIAVGRSSGQDFDKMALEEERFVSWSDYSFQIKPWIKAFGRENILPLIFEDYISDRHETVKKVAAFIGINPEKLPRREAISNSRQSLRAVPSVLKPMMPFIYHPIFGKIVPQSYRTKLRKALTRKINVNEISLKTETCNEIKRRLKHLPEDLRKQKIEPGSWF